MKFLTDHDTPNWLMLLVFILVYAYAVLGEKRAQLSDELRRLGPARDEGER